MNEADTISRVSLPGTRTSLAADLRQLGVRPGMVLLVHSSLSALGWVVGGPVAVIQALQDVLTTDGTLVMPAHTSDYSDPAGWQNPPVPAAWVQTIRDEMPLYDPARSPTRQMGRIAELFRTWPGVLRSAHPQTSFAAWGRRAAVVTAGHAPANGLGETSPLARIYDLNGSILLLGIGHANNTSFHLAEYRAPGSPAVANSFPWLENGRRVWATFDDIDLNDSPFPYIGAELEATGAVAIGKVAAADARLMSQRTAVDFATDWLSKNRPQPDIA